MPAATCAGLDWRTARRRLCQVCDNVLAAETARLRQESWHLAAKEALVSQGALFLCVVVLGIGQALGEHYHDDNEADRVAKWVYRGVLLANVVLNVWIVAARHVCQQREVLGRVRKSVGIYRKSVLAADHKTAGDGGAWPLAGQQLAVLKQGSPLVSIYPVFREGKWQRVPALLLVEDDVIALGTSDMTPARVEELDCDSMDDGAGEEHDDERPERVHYPFGASPLPQVHCQGAGAAAWLPAGAKVGFRPDRRISFLRKCTISPTSRRLLVLCGDMRCFRVGETPLRAFLEEMLRPVDDSDGQQHPSPDTLFAKDMQVSRIAAMRGALVLMAILLLVVSLRFVWQEEEKEMWQHYLLKEPACVAVLALPVARPTLALLVEALSTARLLTVVERLQEQQRAGVKTNTQQKKEKGESDLEPEQRIRLTSSRRDRISVRRFLRYFLATLRARLLPPSLFQFTLRHDSAKAHVAVDIDDHHHHHKGGASAGVAPPPPPPPRRVPLLPIPLIQSRTVERLGAVTMLGVVDDELLVADAPSPEEVFLLKSKRAQEASASTVLQIMHEPDSFSSPSCSSSSSFSSSSSTAVKFEDPSWTQHLPSLKPLGFSCLAIAETEARQNTTQQQWATLGPAAVTARTAAAAPATAAAALVDFVRDDSSSQHKAYLGQLARGIGFSAADDLRPHFCERGRLLVVAPHLVDARASEDVNASSLEETRARGTLQPHLTSVVWEDLRRRAGMGTGGGDGSSGGGMQLLSEGTPALALPMCTEYFDGSVIAHLTAEDRRLIVATWKAWALEDYHVVCFSYTPVPPVLARRFAQRQLNDPPLYLVDNYTEAQQLAHLDAIREQALQEREARLLLARQAAATGEGGGGGMGVGGGDGRKRKHEEEVIRSAEAPVGLTLEALERREEGPSPSPSSSSGGLVQAHGQGQSSPSVSGSETPSSHGDTGSVGVGVAAGMSSMLTSAHASISMPDLLRASTDPIPEKATTRRTRVLAPNRSNKSLGESRSASSAGGGTTGKPRREQGQGQDDELLWGLLRRQVLLGMVASSVLPRREVPGLVEEMMASGVRFLFFSPRNMRRTKKLAEQMGIAMDWNAAVSLRPSVVPVPSSHLIVGRGDVYGDWATKSRLPHGTAAIREHLRDVDNVPLLVSVFTDATPPTIDEMFVVFQEYHESVLCVGCGFRSTNAQLFRRADVAISMGGMPGGMHPKSSAAPFATSAAAGNAVSSHGLSPMDVAFNEALVGIFCAFRLGAAANGTATSLAVLTDIVKESRRLLGCFYQCVSLGTTILSTAALFVVLPHVFPLPVASTRGRWSLADTLWVLWVILPLLVLPLLVTPADAGLLGRCPRKNIFKANEHNALRSGRALVLRCLSTVLLCLYVHARCLASLLLRLPDVVAACELRAGQPSSVRSAGAQWWAVLACPEHSSLLRQGQGEVAACYSVAHDLLLLSLALCWTVQSSSFLHRTASLWEESPLRNVAWVLGGVCLMAGQTVHFVIRGLIQVGREGLGAIGWDVWVVIVAVAPWMGLALAEYAKGLDAKILNRHARFRRLEFATRLGMHSPK